MSEMRRIPARPDQSCRERQGCLRLGCRPGCHPACLCRRALKRTHHSRVARGKAITPVAPSPRRNRAQRRNNTTSEAHGRKTPEAGPALPRPQGGSTTLTTPSHENRETAQPGSLISGGESLPAPGTRKSVCRSVRSLEKTVGREALHARPPACTLRAPPRPLRVRGEQTASGERAEGARRKADRAQ